jgi:hypothetical protein
MTPSKTPKMKAIIKDIAKLNPNIKALTYDNFVNTEAKELLLEYKDEDKILEQKKLLHKIAKVPISDIEELFPTTKSQEVSNFNNTAKFFGINTSMESLIQKLSNPIFTTIIISERQIEDGIINSYEYKNIKNDFDNWINLCKRLDLFKKYFDSLNQKQQEQLKEGLKILNKAPFIEDNNISKEFGVFLLNHRMSQLRKFKISKLLELNIPNITTTKIAEDIYKFTNLKHN